MIAEVMVDPADEGSESSGEWVNLYNATDRTIEISGWSIRDSKATTKLARFELRPKASALIAASERVRQQVQGFDGQWIQLDGRIGNGLGNSGDELVLLDSAGQVIDGISWGASTTILDPSIKTVAAGETLKRQLPHDTDTAADWEPTPPSDEQASDHDAGIDGDSAGSDASATINSANEAAPNASGGSDLDQSTSLGAARVILSEIGPKRAWLELYNAQPHLQAIGGWMFDDDDLETPPFVFPPETTIDAHGFLVVEAADLKQLHGPALRLLRPDGSLADMLSITSTTTDTTLSRYPVHGGGWQPNTPPTRGTFNQAPPPTATPTPSPTSSPSPRPAAPPIERASKKPAATTARPDWLKRLLAPLLALSLVAAAIVWSRWGQMGADTLEALARRSSQNAEPGMADPVDEQDEEAA